MSNQITFKQYSVAYDLAKKLYQNDISQREALNKVQDVSMNVESAKMYFRVFERLVNGESFNRTINASAFDYYLEKIYSDFGKIELENALTALNKHIEYNENRPKGSVMVKVREIHKKYLQFLNEETNKILVEEEDEKYFREGKEYFKPHRKRERNKKLVRIAKEQHLKNDPSLKCQVCGFSFTKFYGQVGKGFIEAHHIIPISKLKIETETKVEDIALVCSNCHRMLHRSKTGKNSIKKLRKLIKHQKSNN
ncbi:MAG: HNH endonuclease [Bacteroidota bacterium]